MKLKKRYIVITVIAVLIAAGVFFVHKSGIITAFEYSKSYSSDQLGDMMKENSEQLDGEIRTYFGNNLREYTEEEKRQLESGEVTADVLLSKIIAEKYENDENKKTVQGETSPTSQVPDNSAKAEAITGKYVSRLYSLQGTYIGKLDGLLNTAIAEYKAVPEEKRSKAKMISIASKYIPKGYALESSCDAQVNSLLADLKKELEVIGADTSIISTIRSHYQSEKSMKKAYYLNLIK